MTENSFSEVHQVSPVQEKPDALIKSPGIIKEKLLGKISRNPFCFEQDVLPAEDLNSLYKGIMSCKYLAENNLNSDFVSTRGFSVVFQRSEIEKVKKQFSFFSDYLELALSPDCNCFYLNPLLLGKGSVVYPHIDRSLRSYLKTIEPPLFVSVFYVQVPEKMIGGELVVTSNKKKLGSVKPQANTLLYFQGHLTHSVNRVESEGRRLSLVCEQYLLNEDELEQIPKFTIESKKLKY